MLTLLLKTDDTITFDDVVVMFIQKVFWMKAFKVVLHPLSTATTQTCLYSTSLPGHLAQPAHYFVLSFLSLSLCKATVSFINLKAPYLHLTSRNLITNFLLLLLLLLLHVQEHGAITPNLYENYEEVQKWVFLNCRLWTLKYKWRSLKHTNNLTTKPRKVETVVAQTRSITLTIRKSWKHQISSFNTDIKFNKHNEQGESTQECRYDKL